MRVLSLCDGIASGLEVLKRLGIACEYHAIEINEAKRKIVLDNHKDVIRPANDVYEFEPIKKYDLVLCGFTCTSLSSQGKREDWDGESKIFFRCVEILEAVKKKNPKVKFFFENVASMKTKCKDEITKTLGVEPFLGLSSLVSMQDRKRLYWFNWEAPKVLNRELSAQDILDQDGLHLFSFSKSNRNKKGEAPIIKGRMKSNGRAGTLVTGQGCNGRSTMNKVVTKKMKIRDLTVSECAKLQGLGNYLFNCSEASAFEAIGEGWELNMVQEIFKNLEVEGIG